MNNLPIEIILNILSNTTLKDIESTVKLVTICQKYEKYIHKEMLENYNIARDHYHLNFTDKELLQEYFPAWRDQSGGDDHSDYQDGKQGIVRRQP